MEIDDLFFDRSADLTITHRKRPHWKQPGKVHFVTWRQADSLAQAHLEQLRRDQDAWSRTYGAQEVGVLSLEIRRMHHRLFRARVEQWLDAGAGSCALEHPAARGVVRETLLHFEGTRYRLGSFAIAGNHVHVLVVPLPGHDLSQITHSWKSYTAKEINKMLGRTGQFWQAESFDHLVRSAAHLERFKHYIEQHVHQGAVVERRPLMNAGSGS